MNKKVFVLNNSGHDFKAAESFGEVVFLTKGYINKNDCTAMVRTLLPFIEESNANDLIVQTGPSILSGIACAMFASKHNRLNLLLFDGETYVERNLDFHHILPE